jgi:hypothetical protein
MISYELAKQLKEARHPFLELTDHEDCVRQQVEIIDGVAYHIPNLSELIEACGSVFWCLELINERWLAAGSVFYREKTTYPEYVVFGKTPEEAVALLYLKLKKYGKD